MDDPRAITRPDPALHRYYLIVSFFGLIFFPFIYIPLLLKYRTIRYRFDEEGVSMAWGRFFEQETFLTYRRIQDIQVTRGVIQRRLGLASLKLQTASGGSGAEMTIEGIRDPDRLRDFLYERMRGADDDPVEGERDDGARLSVTAASPDATAGDSVGDEALQLLREIRDELRQVREAGGSP